MRIFFRSLTDLFRRGRLRRHKRSVLTLEQLESRDVPALVSPTALWLASGAASPNGLPAGLSPAQVRQAYGFNQVFFNNGTVRGDGSGQTIAIVDAYDQPNIAGDLAAFDATYGIAAPPSFTKVNENGGSSLPAADQGWGLEISLDVEWAHAIAPGASILLVEASSNSSGDLLAAENYARTQPNVSVVSMSWGAAEFSGEASLDSYFATPSGHNGVTFVASSGDSGSSGAPIWPSVSPNVLAVGGTQISTDAAGDYLGETGWSGSGGGLSTGEGQPGYQKGVVTQSSTARAVPDVAYDASSGSPFAVYDTGYGGWIEAYGTSAGAPQWSALVAIADQGRVLAGEGTLDGGTQTLPLLYQLPSSDFHDITSGSNGGYSAGAGYDLVTGRGTPVANLIVSGLVGTVSNPPPSQSTPTVTVSDPSGSYRGGAFTATGSVTGANGAFLATPTFTYYSVGANGSLTTLASAPINVGNYLVLASYAGGQNYTPASASAAFTITQAVPNVAVRDAGGVYNGAAYTAIGSVTAPTGSSLGSPTLTYYSVSSTGALTALAAAPINPGNYLVIASYIGSQNYTTASASAAFTISPASSAATSYAVADFSGNGLWRYAPTGGWLQLAVTDATQAAVDARGDVVAVFRGYGVWRYEDSTGWERLTGADAAQVAIAGNGIVAGAFSGQGVWRFEDTIGWRQLGAGTPAQLAVDDAGDVAGAYGGNGVWRYEDVVGWQELAGWNASQVAIAGNGVVAATFSGQGVWRFEDGAGWQQLTASTAAQVAVDAQGDVAVEITGKGVWRYENVSGWQQLTTSDAAQIAITGNGVVAAEFSPWGIWIYGSGWQQLTSANAYLLGVGA